MCVHTLLPRNVVVVVADSLWAEDRPVRRSFQPLIPLFALIPHSFNPE
jgi:hypothetical protein